jgi:TatD DNase family protein
MFTDSHCHLNFPDFHERIDAVLADMAQAQVSRAVCICTTLEEFGAVHQLALDHDNLWATVGVHPDNEGVQEPTLADLLQRAALPRVVAIGETGLDYYRLGERTVADMAWQRDRFRTHIEAARQTDLPLVIHTRSSSDDTLAIVRESGGLGGGAQGGLPVACGVFHCFTESLAVARAALDMGFFISFSGILTFKTAAELREVARFVPLDRLLIETDSPYLAPVPHRGKTNTPAWVPHVAAMVAQLKGLPVEEVAQVTSANTTSLFRRMAQPTVPDALALPVAVAPQAHTLPGGGGPGALDRRQWLGAVASAVVVAAGGVGWSQPVQAQASAPPEWWTSVQRDDLSAVLLWQLRGADINALDGRGQHALHIALRHAALKVARYLVERPSTEVDVRNPQGETPLMLAVLKGHTEVARALVARQADVNKTGWTPLHYAATYGGTGAVEQVQWLLDQHAYIDAESPNLTTPLMMAAHYGSAEVVRLLLDAGADASLRNEQQLTAMDFAMKASRPSVAELIASSVRSKQPRGRW